MRAVFYEFDSADIEGVIQITGDAAHHLNVVRIRNNEPILLLNGKGLRAQGVVINAQKNLIEARIAKVEKLSPSHEISLAVASPKKEAFEDILKAAVELGIRNIYPLSSEFSQYDYAASERIDRILESALVQSNNPFWPTLHAQVSLKDFLSNHQDTLVFFNSQKGLENKISQNSLSKKTVLIGPEGGFSPSEVTLINSYSKIQEIHLPTPILRAPTAVPAAVGYLLALSK